MPARKSGRSFLSRTVDLGGPASSVPCIVVKDTPELIAAFLERHGLGYIIKMSGSLPENVNFGIKASTVRQFLTSSGLPTKWSDKSKPMSTKHLAKIAKRQTVMVVCHQ